jgi:hypothetical protein
MGSLKRLICAVRGHEDYLHFEKNRVYLECIACGYESPGWSVGERKSKVLQLSSKVADANRARFDDLRVDAA